MTPEQFLDLVCTFYRAGTAFFVVGAFYALTGLCLNLQKLFGKNKGAS